MTFLVRILFSGLMAFVPSEDGTDLTVLLLNVDSAYHHSDGSTLAQHKPLLLARAGNCTGDCPTDNQDIAEYLYADKTTQQALSSYASAVSGGGGWLLSGTDIEFRKGSSADPALPELEFQTGVRATVNGNPAVIPASSSEREDYSWIANLKQLCPSTCTLNSDVFSSAPPNLIAARLHIRNGKVYTYSVARIGSDVTPVNFKRLDGTGSASSYTQAVASWVGADIEVEGDSIEIAESAFSGSSARTMTLEPDENGNVEVAVINLPPFVPPSTTDNESPQVGKHFELYYDLLDNPPDPETRLVPRAGVAGNITYDEVDWSTVHPTGTLFSELLNQLRLNIGRSAYDRTLCPPADIPQP